MPAEIRERDAITEWKKKKTRDTNTHTHDNRPCVSNNTSNCIMITDVLALEKRGFHFQVWLLMRLLLLFNCNEYNFISDSYILVSHIF